MDKFDVLFQALSEFESMVLKLPKKNYATQLRFSKKYVVEKYSYLMLVRGSKMKLRLLQQIYTEQGSRIDDTFTPTQTYKNDVLLQSFNDNTNEWETIPLVIEEVESMFDFINNKQTNQCQKK
jgi:hypothetical protein